ncbi:MAG TPA: hypothetical protein VKA85_01280 [Candidatus Limnocylindrales bacterium]|nr:hypothetical protein [Candidatus Limnocylindrales bacterium]
MKMRDWDEQGLVPAFGHQGEWLADILDRAGSPEIAAYAIDDGAAAASGEDERPADRARRFLVASELGLLDGRYEPPKRGREARLTTRLVVWRAVRGVNLETETTVDEALRHRTTWKLRLDDPEVVIAEPASDDAVIELWRECVLHAAPPPGEKPAKPE